MLIQTLNRSQRRALELRHRASEIRALREIAGDPGSRQRDYTIPAELLERLLQALPASERRRYGPLSTSDSASATLSVNMMLRQPPVIARDLVNVILQRGGFLADRLLVRGSAESVAGGAMRYQRSGDSYLDHDPEEIAEDADWPRAGWTEELRTEAVKQYGLEVPVSMLSIRRNQIDQVTRAERRLANSIVKFVDTKAITMLRTDADIQTFNANNWDAAAADIIGDVAEGQELMDTLDEGLFGQTLVVPKTMRVHLLGNTALRDALKGQGGSESVRTGQVANFLGLDNIYFTNQVPDDEALLIDVGVAGTIADEAPDASEGWSGYGPGAGFAPIYVQVYDEKRPKRKVVAGGRWPAMALVEPRAVVKFTSTTT